LPHACCQFCCIQCEGCGENIKITHYQRHRESCPMKDSPLPREVREVIDSVATSAQS
jgi:hypothetical protein